MRNNNYYYYHYYAKYASITNTHIFVPVAIETLGPICSRGLSFLVEIINRLAAFTGDARHTSFYFNGSQC